MKEIAITKDGGSIVEFSSEEREVLTKLIFAMKGKNREDWPNSFPHHNTFSPVEVSKVFTSIRMWMMHHFRINEMQQALDDLKKSVGLEEVK